MSKINRVRDFRDNNIIVSRFRRNIFVSSRNGYTTDVVMTRRIYYTRHVAQSYRRRRRRSRAPCRLELYRDF